MKKIFYILASAIVALGAVACQNEVDENITSGTQNDNVVSFSVSFDESTRIAMGEVVDGKANFVFEGNETLYLKYDDDVYEFHNTTDAPNTFTGEGDGLSDIVSEQYVLISNKKNLEDASNKHNTFNDAAYFRFDGTIGNGSVNLTLSNHVFHCTTGSEPVRLYCDHYRGYPGEEAPEYLDLEANNEYWIDLDNSKTNEIAISYDINGVKVKSTTLNGNTFKIFNLGTLSNVKSKEVVVNNTEELQAALDAATDGNTIKLVAGVEYGAVYMGRPTAQNNTVMFCQTDNFTTTDAEEFKEHLADGKYHTTPRYTTTLSNLTIVGAEGATIAGLLATSGHAYGAVTDYVLGKTYESGSGYYNTLHMSNIKFEGVAFTGKIDINTSDAESTYTGVSFEGCEFTTGGTASTNGAAVRYYNESNNGNVNNIVVNDCTFNNVYQGVYVQNVNGVSVTNSKFDTTGHNAIAIQSTGENAVDVKAVTITDNTFANIADRIIRFNYVGADSQITITGNTSTNSGDEDGELIKASFLATGATAKIENNNWNGGKNVEVTGGNDSAFTVAIITPTVATVGGVEYTSVESAFAAVAELDTTEQVTITLADNASIATDASIVLTEGNIKLDLNGKILSADNTRTATHNFLFDVKGGQLEIVNGTIEYTHTGSNMAWDGATTVIDVTAGGVLNLQNVNIINHGGTDMNFAVHLNNWGEVTVNADHCVFAAPYCGFRVNNSGFDMNNVTITNSTFTGKARAFWVHNYIGDLDSTKHSDAAIKERLNLNIYNNGNTFTITDDAVSPIRYGFGTIVYFTEEGNRAVGDETSLVNWANEVNNGGNSFVGKTIVLTKDVTLTKAWTPVGQTGATQFRGTFDGNDKTISNLNIDATAQTGANYSSGIFGWLNAATVKNVKVVGATVKGNHNVGVIAGYMETAGCTITGCSVEGATVEGYHANDDACGDKVGVIVGHAGNAGVVVSNCTATNSTVTAARDAGQIVGAAKEANVTDCSAENVTVAAWADNTNCTGTNINNAVIGRVL